MFDTVKCIWALGKCAIEITYSILFDVHNHIILVVAAMDSCFLLIRTHKQGIAPGKNYRNAHPLLIVDRENADK